MKQGNVFISGGSRGIGAEMVKLFSNNGYRVGFTYFQSEEKALKLAEKYHAVAIQADSADPVARKEAVKLFHEKLGKASVLIHNAAVAQIKLFTDFTDDEWHRMLAVNLDAPMDYTKQFLPDMIEKKQGRIINITSMWGQVGASCEVPYSTTKAALIGFTKALAKEVGPSGITVNAIAPGVIDTEMNQNLDAEALNALCEDTPLGRLGKADEVARLALFLSEEGGDFITGQVIAINGGFVI